MPQPYDATTKDLLEFSPEEWPKLAGLGTRKVQIIDADISTVSGATDKVIRVQAPRPSLLSIDFQSGPDADAPCRMLVYNAVLGHRHKLPVRSLLVLLAPKADLRQFNGLYERGIEDAPPDVVFRYGVIRVWRLPPDRLLDGGIGILPLAPISELSRADLPNVIGRMRQRLADSCGRADQRRLWASTYVLMGLRYEQAFVDLLLSGVIDMEESVTYQAIIERGRALGREEGREEGALREARKSLLLAGLQLLGRPNAQTRRSIDSIQDVTQLEKLISRVGQAASWNELLGFGQPKRRRKGSQR